MAISGVNPCVAVSIEEAAKENRFEEIFQVLNLVN